MATYQVYEQEQTFPVDIGVDDSVNFVVAAINVTGLITAIRVQDIARQVWYNWGNQVARGWDTSDWTGTEGEKNLKGPPACRAGMGNLYIAFAVKNVGTTAGTIHLSIQSFDVELKGVDVLAYPNTYSGIELTTDMPTFNLPLVAVCWP